MEFGGGWQIATRPEFSPIVEKLLKGRRFARLSKAGLEVLAIIAYRQPITRLEIDEIRGVQSSGALATLQERNLITVVGRSEALGHPLLYGTTREFLLHLGLKGLSQLPDLPTIEEVVENREDLRAFASQFGEELTDEDFETLTACDEVRTLRRGRGRGDRRRDGGWRRPRSEPEPDAEDETGGGAGRRTPRPRLTGPCA